MRLLDSVGCLSKKWRLATSIILERCVNNRLDFNDMWRLISSGDKITFWCVDSMCEPSKKRPREKVDETDQPPSKKTNRIDSQKAQAKEYEMELKTNINTPFQCKLWAEMYANCPCMITTEFGSWPLKGMIMAITL